MASAAEHRSRTRAAMAAAGVDVLLLGREANARYVSGADRLWLAGTRPFASSCVLVGETGAVGLLNVTDDGVPDDVPRSGLYPISWNPMNLVAGAAAVVGDATVRHVGVDSMSPLFAQLLAAAFPDAELTDGEALVRGVRRTKTDDDVTALRAAVAVAASGARRGGGRWCRPRTGRAGRPVRGADGRARGDDPGVPARRGGRRRAGGRPGRRAPRRLDRDAGPHLAGR